MTRYLTEEKFLVTARDPEAQKRYAENWERTFGEKKEEEKPELEDDFSSWCGHPRGSDQCHDCLPAEEEEPPPEHTNGVPGFAPCTREWPHDGPCAHPVASRVDGCPSNECEIRDMCTGHLNCPRRR